ncbi:MAG: serine/threonine-protein kinase [Mariniblastus sp.]|nr:serine/threonine-protein kinase [Mariniblastus sp.]
MDHRSQLDRLAVQFIQELRSDQSVSIESYAERNPQWAEEIRKRFPVLLKKEKLRQDRKGKRDGRIAADGARLEQLGDFLILDEIGRGGMGVVYEAVQQSLERRVALKVLPTHVFRDSRLDDFLAEAKVSARLHHTNIVPIYGVGQQDGVNYYVMQLIEGVSLDSFVARADERELPAPLSPLRVAEIGRQVALALSYAHQQGTLHRDIKPGNLLQDDQGNIWVTDFGLAFNEPDSPGGDVEVSGTLRYLPPERFSGRYDERSDIFALGITLIELLTGQSAYDAGSRGALQKQIMAGSIDGLKQLGGSVPRDLKAILGRATDVNPRNRFPTADDFARDLDHFLHGRPIESRRFSLVERSWRWACCNPSLATMSCFAVLLLMTVTALTSIGYFTVSKAYDAELTQRRRAESVAELASSAMDRIFVRFAPDSLFADSESFEVSTRQPILSYEAAALLQEMLRFYRHLSVDESANLEIRLKSALAQSKVGEINERLGSYKTASNAFEMALIKIRNMSSEQRAENQIFEARILNQLGAVYALMGEDQLAKKSIQEAIEILESASDGGEDFRLEEARSYYYLARRIRPGMGPEILPPDESSPLWDGPAVPTTDADNHRRNYLNLAIELVNQEDFSDANLPLVAKFKHLLALCYREMAADRSVDQDWQMKELAIELLRDLVEAYPEQNQFRFDLLETLADVKLFRTNLSPEQIHSLESHLEMALREADYLVMQRPDVMEYRIALVHSNFKLAEILKLKSKQVADLERAECLERAERSMQRAIFQQRNLIQVFPSALGYQVWNIRFLVSMAELKISQDKMEQAERFVKRAASAITRLPEAAHTHWIVGALESEIASLQQVMGSGAAENSAVSD